MSLFRDKPSGPVIRTQLLKLHWDSEDPFVFISHHCDDYPPGNAQQAPPLQLISGRNLGRDYQPLFGFRMYHGKVVPGFPMHSHWGYETVTIAEKGYIDHFDSKGNQGRFGFGDVQWVSAGSRYQHNEMYPLAFSDRPNPNDITQIMINLPLKDKESEPVVRTMWSEDIPIVEENGYYVKIIAGSFGGKTAIRPNDISWAADDEHRVRILLIRFSPDAELQLSAISPTLNRNLYFVDGDTIEIGGIPYKYSQRLKLDGNADILIKNGGTESVCWLIEGEPINEKQSSFGPVILKNDKKVRAAIDEIRKKEFPEWPWDLIDKAQPKGTERFIRYADGTEDRPGA
ncbi:MAG: pirin family protein [Candidatus Methanoplasma sp.]|jgi:redox-sensitive bicupin YhaK (pirin superfamily)|nr:pirin family protein [Candidatus Methanoplasma sp.]